MKQTVDFTCTDCGIFFSSRSKLTKHRRKERNAGCPNHMKRKAGRPNKFKGDEQTRKKLAQSAWRQRKKES